MPTPLILNSIIDMVAQAVDKSRRDGFLQLDTVPTIEVERPTNPEHGDFATSLPLRLARATRINPFNLAQTLVENIPPADEVEELTAVAPGFINFKLRDSWVQQQVELVRRLGAEYGNVDFGQGRRMMVEFVSVNPTGPVHIGHARGAVLGSSLANILAAAGFDVTREYYVNDAGSQMQAFYGSVLARYLQALGQDSEMPANGYVGEYIVDLAREIVESEGRRFADMDEASALKEIGDLGREKMVALIREDLEQIGVTFDNWFSERSLFDNGDYDRGMQVLREHGYLAERENATWFTSSALGDDKDNVVIRSSGEPTYFASDIAYHYNKFVQRGFDGVVNIWGADHQGHVPRMKSAVQALGIDPDKLTVLISQMVSLKRGREVVRVSKRTGELVTLRELSDEVGRDACRFFLPGPYPIDSNGIRPGAGQAGVQRKSGLLHPVRPRPQQQHPEAGAKPGHRLERGRCFVAKPPQRAGADTGHASLARARRANGPQSGTSPLAPPHHGIGQRIPRFLRKLPGRVGQPRR